MASVLWFRKGLRLHDNVALHECLQRMGQGSATQLLPIFVLDPWFVSSGSVGAHRMQFLLESLRDLDSQLRALNSRLLVFRGNPLEVIPAIVDKYSVKTVCAPSPRSGSTFCSFSLSCLHTLCCAVA
jgi:cryptochrome